MRIQSAVTLSSSTACFRNAALEVENAVYVSYLENGFLGEERAAFLRARSTLPDQLLCQTWKRIGFCSARCPKAPKRLIEKLVLRSTHNRIQASRFLLLPMLSEKEFGGSLSSIDSK